MTCEQLLEAVATKGGCLPAWQFGDLTTDQLRARIDVLYQKAEQHDQHAADHTNAARLCRVAAVSAEEALGLRETKAA